MKTKLVSQLFFCITFLFSALTFAQNNQVGLGGYFGNGLSINANYAYSFDNSFFVQPNLSASITKKDKDIFSFVTYEINLGYYLLNGTRTKLYFSLGGTYNSFLSQSHEGNASFISDAQPPYYSTGKTREDCFGITGKVGSITSVNSWFNLGFEARYLALFPKVKYNYIPTEYSTIKGTEAYNMILIGMTFGFSF